MVQINAVDYGHKLENLDVEVNRGSCIIKPIYWREKKKEKSQREIKFWERYA